MTPLELWSTQPTQLFEAALETGSDMLRVTDVGLTLGTHHYCCSETYHQKRGGAQKEMTPWMVEVWVGSFGKLFGLGEGGAGSSWNLLEESGVEKDPVSQISPRLDRSQLQL